MASDLLYGPSMASGATPGYYDYNSVGNQLSNAGNSLMGGAKSLMQGFTQPMWGMENQIPLDNLTGQPLQDAALKNMVNGQNAGPSMMDTGMGLMNAYNMYNQWDMQNDYMDLQKEQLGMAREQWDMTKDEVNRISRVRNNLTTSY